MLAREGRPPGAPRCASPPRGGTSPAHRPLTGLKARFDPPTVNKLPTPVRHQVFSAISHAIQGVFLWAVPATVAVFILAWFIKKVPLRGREQPGEQAQAQPEFAA